MVDGDATQRRHGRGLDRRQGDPRPADAHREHHRFPLYGFDGHVGYGTPMHRAAVRRHGPCELHRRSFMSIAYEQLVLLEHGEEEA